MHFSCLKCLFVIVTYLRRLYQIVFKFHPIPAGVLENQDMLGGGQFDPTPSKSHVLCPNMTNDTPLESSCALLLESAKKLQICKN